jgi:hypothetical protein
MWIVVRNPYGFHLVTVLPKRQMWTSQYYSDHIFAEISSLRGTEDQRKLMGHIDNAKPPLAKRLKQFLVSYNLRTGSHRLFSPDLAPSDLFFFGCGKRMFQGAEFPTAEALLEAVIQIMSEMRLETLIATFRQGMKRLQACVDNPGECVK